MPILLPSAACSVSSETCVHTDLLPSGFSGLLTDEMKKVFLTDTRAFDEIESLVEQAPEAKIGGGIGATETDVLDTVFEESKHLTSENLQSFFARVRCLEV